MRTQVRMAREPSGGFRLTLTPSQRDAALSALELMRSLPISAAEIEVQVGTSREIIEHIERQIRRADAGVEIGVTMTEVHVIHASLVCSLSQFTTEEDFYVRTGFFRQNIAGLAQGIVRAIGGSAA